MVSKEANHLVTFLLPSLSPLSLIEKIMAPEVSQHEITYVTNHKGPSLVAAFSSDGEHHLEKNISHECHTLY